MQGILIYSEELELAAELLSVGRRIARETGLALKAVSINDDQLANGLVKKGAEVYRVNNENISLADTAAVAAALKQVSEMFALPLVILSSNRRGKELSGRVAQMLDAGCVTDVEGISLENGKILCTRNTLGGATVAVQSVESPTKVIAIQPKAFKPAEEELPGTVIDLPVEGISKKVKLMDTIEKSRVDIDIASADILVAVGQGVKDEAEIARVEKIAKALGGEVACSKPVATDKKWLPEDRVIGLSGKKCKPSLAVILGVSGQVQFTVGIREAKTIVAVNNDENAYMLKMADYAMVADLEEVIPELLAMLEQ